MRRLLLVAAVVQAVIGLCSLPVASGWIDLRLPSLPAPEPRADQADGGTASGFFVPGEHAIVAPAEVSGAMAPAAPMPPQLLETPPAARPADVFAVVIGIDDYPGGKADLRSAVADADDMVAALARHGVPSSNIVALRDGQATASTIEMAASWLAAAAGPGTTAVFFYAGHVRKLAFSTEAVLAADGQTVTDVRLGALFAPMAARHAWFVLASCYGGGFTELLSAGRVLTAAADADSLAYETDEFGRSYLGEYLVRRTLLLGTTAPTVQDAVAAAQSALRREQPRRLLTHIDQAGETVWLVPMAATAPGSAPAQPARTATAPAPASPPRRSPPPTTTTTPPPPEEPPTECGLVVLFCSSQ
jgi:hypothetical protein